MSIFFLRKETVTDSLVAEKRKLFVLPVGLLKATSLVYNNEWANFH